MSLSCRRQEESQRFSAKQAISSKEIYKQGLEREDLELPKEGLIVDLTVTCSIT